MSKDWKMKGRTVSQNQNRKCQGEAIKKKIPTLKMARNFSPVLLTSHSKSPKSWTVSSFLNTPCPSTALHLYLTSPLPTYLPGSTVTS